MGKNWQKCRHIKDNWVHVITLKPVKIENAFLMISVLGKGILIFTVDKAKVPSIVNNGRSIFVTQIQVYLLLANLPIKGCDIDPHFPGGFIEGILQPKL